MSLNFQKDPYGNYQSLRTDDAYSIDMDIRPTAYQGNQALDRIEISLHTIERYVRTLEEEVDRLKRELAGHECDQSTCKRCGEKLEHNAELELETALEREHLRNREQI